MSVIAINISSRYFDLKPSIAALARDAGMICRFQDNQPADTLETLTAKVHAAEHRLLPAVIARLSTAK